MTQSFNSSSGPRGAAGFYAAVALLAGCVLMLQVAQTRILSVTSWYYLGFFIISMAMFGLTAGALRVQRRGTEGHEAEALGAATLHFGWAVAGSLGVQLVLTPVLVPGLTTLVAVAALAVVLAVPHYFAGIALALALTRCPYPVGRVYAADLGGAAAGCVAAIWLLDGVDAPTAVLVVAVGGAAAALAFAATHFGLGAPATRRALLALVALSALATFNAASELRLRPLVVKGHVESTDEHDRVLWNSQSRVTVTPPSVGPPHLWGESRVEPLRLAVEQRFLAIDGDAGTPMYRFRGDTSEVLFLTYDVTQVAHALPGRESVAIIGVGGGRDVLSALLFEKRRIVGIEVNPAFIELLTQDPEISSFAALSAAPGVELVRHEGRSWLAATDERFDLIQMSLTDTWAATGAGAFTLSENGLYTLEAWRGALARLNPEGVLSVSRWFHRDHAYETGRLISLAMATLFDAGVAEPRRHLVVVTSRSQSKANSVATLLLSREPFAPGDLAALSRLIELRGHELFVAPDVTPGIAPLGALVQATNRDELDRVAAAERLEYHPPTDDWPFFFNHVRLSRPGEITSRLHLFSDYSPHTIIGGVILGNIAALLTLWSIAFVSLILVVAVVLWPARGFARALVPGLARDATAYFALIGLGFMLVELALLQRATVFLGQPAYALGVVLATLIAATGVGSLLSERWPLSTRRRGFVWSLGTAATLLLLAFVLPVLTQRFQHLDALGRSLVVVAALAPAGVLLGFGFPTGLRLVAAIDRRPTPWLWGVNGAAGVLAGGLALISSMTLGIRATLIAGALCYALLGLPLAALIARPNDGIEHAAD